MNTLTLFVERELFLRNNITFFLIFPDYLKPLTFQRVNPPSPLPPPQRKTSVEEPQNAEIKK